MSDAPDYLCEACDWVEQRAEPPAQCPDCGCDGLVELESETDGWLV